MKNRAFLAIIIAAILYGTSGVFIKYMSIPASSIAWFRTLIPGGIVAIWILATGKRLFTGNIKAMLLASSLNAIRMYLFFVAYIYTSIGNAVIMYYTWPIFATIFGVTILKESIGKRQVGLLILAFTGIVISYLNQHFSFENQDFIGMSAALLAALLYSLSVIIFKSEAHNYRSEELIFYQNFVGMLVFAPFIFINNPVPNLLDLELVGSYSVLIGIFAYYLFFYGLKHMKASTASMLTYMEIVSALIFSYIFFGDILSWNMFLGGGFIILSTAMLKNYKRS